MQDSLKMSTEDLDFYYGNFHALHGINLAFYENQVNSPYRPFRMRKEHPVAMSEQDE